jgi:hypothetical protein
MRNRLFFCGISCLIILMAVISQNYVAVAAQPPPQWSPHQRIPDFQADTWPPLMVADQNRTVHAFSSQWLDDGEGESMRAIMYSQWTLEQGWTSPIDILLSPLKKDARLTGVFLDQAGIIHLTFWGGDNTEAYIYYSKAPAISAGRATAWANPMLVDQAGDPELAGLTGDDQGNLAIVYSGKREGNGLYTLYSADGGETWTDPAPVFLTYSELFPAVLRMSPAQSGWMHVVWDVRTPAGQGRQINYARLNLADKRWTESATLAEVQEGYGILNPTVIEHRGEVFVAYSGIIFQRSGDGGQTWSGPVKPFPHVGVNGNTSFVVDSQDNLHFLWAQRITGSPDIHGAWHSMWQNGRWTAPQALVSGPGVSDQEGDRAFDPLRYGR